MTEAILQRVLNQIPVLDQYELRQVQRAVQERLAPREQTRKRRAFYHALRASGLVNRIKTRPPGDVIQRRLVQVQGPPVSQTIIEERR
ncbi:MAG: hypothetical protein NT169_04395 [Chloroflexi bacterium]|nr:hypothetical protein [Chloroflexota bacterium]